MSITNVYEFVTNTTDYANLVSASTFAGLNDALKGANLTLLAPTDSLLGKSNIPDVYRWNSALTSALLLNHVASNTVVFNGTSTDLEMLSGQSVTINSTEVDGITAELGGNDTGYIVYDIDGVLIPDSQTGTSALDETLFDGTAARIGSFFAAEASGTFYDALKVLNNDATADLFSDKLAYTVFLPTEAAWTTLTNAVENKTGTAEYIDDDGLINLLKAHITTGGAAVTDKTFTSLSDTDIVVQNSKVTIGSDSADIENSEAVNFKNGQVHLINKVLGGFPTQTTVEIAIATNDTKTLVDLVTQYKLVDTLNGLKRSTIFAPTNAALSSLVVYATWNTLEMTSAVMTNILKHHVLDTRVYAKDLPAQGKVGEGLDKEAIVLPDLNVILADVVGTNGNIHVVSKPLLPPTLSGAIPTLETVVDIANTTTITSSLYGYLGLFTDIVELLQTVEVGTSFTVFAPNNEAFEALTPADLTYLTANGNAKLKEVLQYHVVSSARIAASLEATNEFPTALGDSSKLTVTKADGKVMVNAGAEVVGADVKAINGVVHVINKVLVPSSVVLPSATVVPPSAASSMAVSAAVMAVASVCIAAL